MNRIKLLTTTAIVAGVLAISAPAMAQEQGWYETLKGKVTAWFGNEPATTTETAEVEAYLDEVTVAVPPVVADDVSVIEPAAGTVTPVETNTETEIDYQEIQNLREQESGLNTEFDYENAVTAFSDPVTADDLNAIETAAGGDAEEITDESVVVVEEDDAQEITNESVVVVQEGDAEEITDESVVVAGETEMDAEAGVETEEIEETATEAEAEAEEVVEETMSEAEAKIEASAAEAEAAIEEMGKAVEAETEMEVEAETVKE